MPQPVETTPADPSTAHPPHAARPNAAHPDRPAGRPRRPATRLAAALLVAGLAIGAAGCFARASAPAAAPGPPPDVAKAIQIAFGSAGQGTVSCMTSIAFRESRWDPGARNSSGASGLFQIMLPLHNDLFYAAGSDPSWWWDPYTNARAARILFDSSGIAPWGSC